MAGNLRLKAKSENLEDTHVPVALFINKVWNIVNQAETDKLISWSEVSNIINNVNNLAMANVCHYTHTVFLLIQVSSSIMM